MVETVSDEIKSKPKSLQKFDKKLFAKNKLINLNPKSILSNLKSAGPSIVADLALAYAADKLILEPLEYEIFKNDRRKKLISLLEETDCKQRLTKLLLIMKKKIKKESIFLVAKYINIRIWWKI